MFYRVLPLKPLSKELDMGQMLATQKSNLSLYTVCTGSGWHFSVGFDRTRSCTKSYFFFLTQPPRCSAQIRKSSSWSLAVAAPPSFTSCESWNMSRGREWRRQRIVAKIIMTRANRLWHIRVGRRVLGERTGDGRSEWGAGGSIRTIWWDSSISLEPTHTHTHLLNWV